MTDQPMKPCREAFEKWHGEKFGYSPRKVMLSGDRYERFVQDRWEAWQAAKADQGGEICDNDLLDIIAEKQANGWEYGTHPRDKARIVLEAIRPYLRQPEPMTSNVQALHTSPERVQKTSINEQPDDCRKAFEVWCRQNGQTGDTATDPNGNYFDSTNAEWKAWLAAWNARQPEREAVQLNH